MQVKREFRYTSGELVQIGDVVRLRVGGDLERVTQIIQPGSEEAEAFLCEETGGVMFEPSAFLLWPDDCTWEDVEFVARQR